MVYVHDGNGVPAARLHPSPPAPRSCNRVALDWIGLSSEVTFIDEPSPAIVTELPIGFVYYDGGKVCAATPLHMHMHISAYDGGQVCATPLRAERDVA